MLVGTASNSAEGVQMPTNLNLYDETLKLLKNRPASLELKEIADDLDNVSYSWLCQFLRGDIPNPTYFKLQKLHDYLISKAKASA